jgi:hypothetical protein
LPVPHALAEWTASASQARRSTVASTVLGRIIRHVLRSNSV